MNNLNNYLVLDGHYLCVIFQAMSAILCCGPCFDPHYLSEEGIIYPWLDLVSLTEFLLSLNIEPIFFFLDVNIDSRQCKYETFDEDIFLLHYFHIKRYIPLHPPTHSCDIKFSNPTS